MSNEMVTQLPTVSSAQLTDVIYAVQGYVSPSNPGTSVQETLQQIFNLISQGIIQNNSGNPNGNVAGSIYNFCWDSLNNDLYICTLSGDLSSAVWTIIAENLIPPSAGGTGVSNPTIHTIPIAEGSSNFNFVGPLTNGQVLIGSTGSDPVPGSLTAGTGINISTGAGSITVSSTLGTLVSPTDGGTGISNPTAHTIAIAEGSSNFNFVGPLTNGQLLIGSTGSDPIPNSLTAGPGINISTSAGYITVSSTLGTLVSPTDGGTGVSSPTAHTIPIAEGSSDFNFVTLNNMQVLLGSTGADPSATTLVAGTGISLTPSGGNLTITNTEAGGLVTPTYGGTGVSNPTAHTLPIAEGSSNFNFLGPLSNGEVLIGSTGSDPTPATLTAGTGMSITNGSGSITIAAGTIPAANGGTGVASPTAHGIAVAEGSSNFTFLTLDNMQVLLGESGSDPAVATIVAGTGINITYAGGNLTITNTEAGGLVFPAYGGTGVSSPTAHAIAVAEGSDNFTFLTLSNMQVLLGSTGADPTAATLTAGAGISITYSAGDLTITNTEAGGLVSPTFGGTGVSNPTAHSLPIAEGSSNFNFVTLNNMQVLLGETGADPTPVTVTAGTGISIVSGGGNLTFSATGEGDFTWNHVTGTSQGMLSENGYVADNSSLVTLSLPTTSGFGDELKIVGKGSGGWSISQGSGQQIFVGSSSTTSGASGSISSTNARDSITLVCIVANDVWTCVGAPQGNLTIV